MIACEGCGVWQHGDCIGLDATNIPDEYMCELCMPEGEIHLARQERLAQLAAANGDAKKKRRKRTHMSLGKKSRRRTTSHNHYAHEDPDDDEEEDDDSELESGSGSPSDGEELDSHASDVDMYDGHSSTRRSSRRRARHVKPIGVDDSPSTTGSSPIAPSPQDGDYESISSLTSPTFSSTTGSPFILPSSAAVVSSPGGALVTIVNPNGSVFVTTSAECSPQPSPTGETKLRSLIFTMEQLANGQLTSPISSAASLSLSQLSQIQTKFTYPVPGVSPPGVLPPSAESSPNPELKQNSDNEATGGGIVNGAENIMSPLILQRQVSENTATAAMTVSKI